MSNTLARFPLLCLLGLTFVGFDVARADGRQVDWARYDALVADSKKAMMPDPKAALDKALGAEAIAQSAAPSSRQTEALATSMWLEAEAYTRINQMPAARKALARKR